MPIINPRALFAFYRKSDPPRECADCKRVAAHGQKRCPECAWNWREKEAQLRHGTTAMKSRLLKKRGQKCEKCGATSNIEMAHKQSVLHGGELVEENLILLCKRCHHALDQRLLEIG